MSKILKVVGASWMQTKISSYILGILGVMAILALFIGQMERIQEDGNYAATVFHSNKTGYRIEYWGQSNKLSDIERGVARAYFRMDVETAGWSVLEIETNGAYPDEVQAYAAGVVEGALTWSLIHNHLQNTIRPKCQDPLLGKQCNTLRDGLDRSVEIWKQQANDKAEDDPFWHHVSLHYTQIRGVYTGWKSGVARSMNDYDTDLSDLHWLNSISEVMEIQHKLNITLENSTLDHLPHLSSAFLKIAEEYDEHEMPLKKLFLAQNAAGSYTSMTRILKRYKFNYHLTSQSTAPSSGVTIEFSGYPGSITSQNEFYLVKGENHRLAISGTPLRNYNSKLWKDTNYTKHIPVAPRITAANHLATNVSAWGHTLARSNSGTACKQWLVLDFDRFDDIHDVVINAPDRDVNISSQSVVTNDIKHTIVHRSSTSRAKGLLWLIEQVPGRTHSADISDAFLEQGYWATYGLPFFTDIAEITHTINMEERYGDIFSTNNSPRAIIFKEGSENVTNLESVLKLMRQNTLSDINKDNNNKTKACNDNDIECIIQEDGYWSVLGVRGDIVEKYMQPYGVIDTKVFTATVNKSEIEFDALSGPPFTSILPDNTTEFMLNKGTVASIYTDQFDDEPFIEIEKLIAKQKQKALEELEILNRDLIKPFRWSTSDFARIKHIGHPDEWAFKPYRPTWVW